jgi:cytochrome P450
MQLREEIEMTLQGRDPDYDSVKNMKYLKAVIDETLRLYPPVVRLQLIHERERERELLLFT